MEKVCDTLTEIRFVIGLRFIGLDQMMSPVPRGVPKDGIDIGVDPLRQLRVLSIEYER